MNRPRSFPRRRPGFTLVELLVVIVILGILIGLLLPAIAAAVKAARAASVQAEISQLAQALADFKSQFGDYPPSRIVVNESGFENPSLPLHQRTMVAFRKFWPRVQLGSGGASPSYVAKTNFFDFNGNGFDDGDTAGANSVTLQGHQCLVFFLGGIPQPSGSTGTSNPLSGGGVQPNAYPFLGVTGFGTNPQNPFSNNQTGLAMYNANRKPPLFEFNSGRLMIPVGDVYGMPGYVDSLNSQGIPPQNFYAYFSTNNGNGYDVNDVNITNPTSEVDALGTSPLTLQFGAVSGAAYQSASPNPYTTGPANVANVAFFNPQTFQIISPGSDGAYGLGGYYNPNATTGSLPTTSMTTNSTDAGVRNLERDNLTNFHNGRLQ